jgi:hypothetical protein
MARYEVICGNIGTVYDGNNPVEARRIYGIYKEQSETGYGRAGGESVTIMEDGEPTLEHIGEVDQDTPEYCDKCGEELDQDCQGNTRCPQCDPPCPCCHDGGGPS